MTAADSNPAERGPLLREAGELVMARLQRSNREPALQFADLAGPAFGQLRMEVAAPSRPAIPAARRTGRTITRVRYPVKTKDEEDRPGETAADCARVAASARSWRVVTQACSAARMLTEPEVANDDALQLSGTG